MPKPFQPAFNFFLVSASVLSLNSFAQESPLSKIRDNIYGNAECPQPKANSALTMKDLEKGVTLDKAVAKELFEFLQNPPKAEFDFIKEPASEINPMGTQAWLNDKTLNWNSPTKKFSICCRLSIGNHGTKLGGGHCVLKSGDTKILLLDNEAVALYQNFRADQKPWSKENHARSGTQSVSLKLGSVHIQASQKTGEEAVASITSVVDYDPEKVDLRYRSHRQ